MRSLSLFRIPKLELELQLAIVAALAVLLGTVFTQGLSTLLGGSATPAHSMATERPTAPRYMTSAMLPPAAQGSVSSVLGANAAAYQLRSAALQTQQARNPAQAMHMLFSRSGVELSAGGLELALGLRATGVNGDTSPVNDVVPRAHANQVHYSHARVREWYANGPLGLEQGFTIQRPQASRTPDLRHSGQVTLSMAISGNAQASLDRGARSVTFTRSSSSLHYGGLIATDATGRTLPSRLSLHGEKQLQIHVDARGARYPLRIDPLIQQGGKLTGAGEVGEGQFGLTVALSADGNTALIAGSHDDDFAGSVWVFTRSGATWAQQGAKLTSPETAGAGEGCADEAEEAEEAGECGFGRGLSLSVDGNTALVGAPRTDHGQGAAFVFTRTGSTWSQQGELSEPSEETREGRLGRSVSLSGDGNTALVGAPADRGGRGAAWVFTHSGSGWQQQGSKLTDPAAVAETHFGGAVALSSDGNSALVGGPGDSGYKGAVWAFSRTGFSWSQQGAKLTANDEQGAGHLGSSIALSADGNTGLVGARADNAGAGAAWALSRTGASWAQQGAKLTGADEIGTGEFGYSVALSADGNTALVGAPRDNLLSGAVRVFTRTGIAWTQQPEQLVGNEQIGNSWVGASVASSSDAHTVLVGAPRDNGRLGAAWPFALKAASTLAPSVSRISPSSGPDVGGTTVTIAGTNFSASTAVRFGDIRAASYAVRSATTIVAVTAPGEGTVDVTVSTPAGTSVVVPPATRFKFLMGAPSETGAASTPPPALNGVGGVLGFAPLAGGASATCKISLRGKTIAVSRRHRAALRLLRTGSGTCRGKLTLSYKMRVKGKRYKLQPIATAVFSIPPGKSRLVTVKLNATGQALLRSGHGKLNASLAILRLLPTPRQARTAGVSLKLQAPRPLARPRA